jgi:hypothetical protein
MQEQKDVDQQVNQLAEVVAELADILSTQKHVSSEKYLG